MRKVREAIILAGPPGSGKSTVLRMILKEQASTEDEWRILDADRFKDYLLAEAIADGSIDGHLAPQEAVDAARSGEKVWPREKAALVHEESSQLVKRARAVAIAEGESIIIDGTLGNPISAAKLAEELEAAGYTMTIIVVDAPRPVAEARADKRWSRGFIAAIDGTAAASESAELGGRWVPQGVVQEMYPSGGDSSICNVSATSMIATSKNVTKVARYHVARMDAAPEATDIAVRTASGWNTTHYASGDNPVKPTWATDSPAAADADPEEEAS
ncbi:zeta toxin family protein [Microbacterium sp. X-17]